MSVPTKSWTLEGEPTPLDRGATHGLGVFETMLVEHGRIVRPEWHFERMENGCRVLEIEAPDRDAVLTALEPEISGHARLRVRVARTAGAGALNHLRGNGSRTILTVSECPPPPESLTVTLAGWPRVETSPLAGVKCMSYAENLLALDAAARAGVDELLFLNTRGEVCEGTTSNLFIEKDGEMLTPPLSSGCLPGTMRRWLLENGMAREARIQPSELLYADRIFLSSATRGVVTATLSDPSVLR